MRSKLPFDPTLPISPGVIFGTIVGVILIAAVVLWVVAPEKPDPVALEPAQRSHPVITEDYDPADNETADENGALRKSHKGTTVKRVKTIIITPEKAPE